MDTVWFGFVQILGILGDVSVSKLLGFETFFFFRWFRIRYLKKLVSKKVSDSVLKKFGIRKSFGLSFVQILSILGDVLVSKLLCFGTFSLF